MKNSVLGGLLVGGMAVAMPLGCGGGGDGRDDMGSVSSGIATLSGTTNGDGGDAAGTGVFDLGMSGTMGADDGSDEDGCTGVDILFIVDDSLSMSDDQMGLAAAFPQFANAIFTALPPGTDLHVGVTTTSGFWAGANSESTNNCVSSHSDADLMTNYRTPADGAGANGQRGQLYQHDGQYYFQINTDADPQALSDWFSVAALRGENGTNVEMHSAAAGWVADPATAATNSGFIRDAGAVLVLFFITDEPDKSPEPVANYVQQVVDAKMECGGANCVITAGAVPSFCYPSANDTTLFDFMNGFGKPPAAVGFIEEDFGGGPPPPPTDYTMILGTALADIIAETCEQIPPIG